RANNPPLLEPRHAGEATFPRIDQISGAAPGRVTLADNDRRGLIRIGDASFGRGASASMADVFHEVGHNWDEASENSTVDQFRALSGWTPRISIFVPLPGLSVSGDGGWQYVS